MAKTESSLIKKLKTGFIGASLIGASYFNYFNNSANAQEVQNNNYMPKYNTTTHYIIKEIQKENAFIEPKTLDNIIDQSKKIITKKVYSEEEAKELMGKINSEIIEKYPELNKDQSCYKKTLTYLAIAEKNNLPLHAVNVPEHMFIRWDPDGKHKYIETNGGDIALFALFTGKLPKTISEEERIEIEKINKGDFNWDPNSLKFNTDQEYFMEFPFPQEMIDKVWLKNLTEKEILAISCKQEAVLLENSEKYQKALECINKSLNLDTSKWEIYAVKGSILSKIGEKECGRKELSQKCGQLFLESNKNYEKAIKMANSKDLSNLGKNFYFLKDYQKSEECFNKTLEVFKNDALLHLKRAKFYHLIGQEEKAIKDLLTALNIEREQIVKSKDKFFSIEFAENIIRYYESKNENKIYLKNITGKEILDWNEAKKTCNIWGRKLPSIEESEDIYKTYKDIKVKQSIWYSGYEKIISPETAWYWTSEGDSQEAFIKSFKDGSVKKIKKNPFYWKSEDINLYQNISGMCIRDLDENKTKNLLNILEKISWNEQKFYHAINKD